MVTVSFSAWSDAGQAWQYKWLAGTSYTNELGGVADLRARVKAGNHVGDSGYNVAALNCNTVGEGSSCFVHYLTGSGSIGTLPKCSFYGRGWGSGGYLVLPDRAPTLFTVGWTTAEFCPLR